MQPASQDLNALRKTLEARHCSHSCRPLASHMDVPSCMLPILASQLCCLGGLYVLLEPQKKVDDPVGTSITPKQRCENWFLAYGIFWISCFTAIVASGFYESMDQWGYLAVCGGLAAPLLLQPLLLPSLTGEASQPLLQRCSTKANLWIGVFSFLGNYWGTHYFYCVLKASRGLFGDQKWP